MMQRRRHLIREVMKYMQIECESCKLSVNEIKQNQSDGDLGLLLFIIGPQSHFLLARVSGRTHRWSGSLVTLFIWGEFFFGIFFCIKSSNAQQGTNWGSIAQNSTISLVRRRSELRD